MASALSSFVAARPAAFTSQQQQRRGGRRLQRCFAAAGDEQKGLDFSSNKRAGLGYTENDSAGQTNIFAVEPKTYVAGSSADSTASGGQATLLIAGVAAVAAVAVLAGGLATNSGPSGLSELAPAEGVKTLTAYSQQFAAEVGAPALN